MAFAIGMRIPPKIRGLGLEGLCAWAASVGLGAVDLGGDVSQEHLATLARHNLRLGSVDAVGTGDILSRDPERRGRGTQALRAHIDRVAELGAKVIFVCFVPGERDISRREAFDIWAEAFPPIVEHAESKGVSFAVEGWPGGGPLYSTVGYTPEVLRAMIERCPSPSLGLCYDPSHLVRLGIDHLRFLDEFASRVRHCHGKDTELLPDGQYRFGHMSAVLHKSPGFSEGPWRYCIPGDGTVNWARVGFRLHEAGYSGPISIELEDARYWGSLELEQQGIVKALGHLRSHAC